MEISLENLYVDTGALRVEKDAVLLLVFYYCICSFLCRFHNFNQSLSFVAISAALCCCFKVMLLVRILPLHAGPHLWVAY